MAAKIVALILAILGALPHERLTAKHTYNRHVRPILVKHCAACHSPGGIAPMSLMSYGDASPWAAAIRTQVLERKMPPWQPEEGIGEFHGARYLSAKEIEAIIDWATGGTPEGDPARLEPVISSEATWTLGKPDRVLEAPAVAVGADVMEETKCFELGGVRPFSAIDFQPGNREMVRRATITAAPGCANTSAPLALWLPGSSPLVAPNGYTWPAQKLYLGIHYRKSWRHDGKELRDQSRVGIYYADARARMIQSRRIEGTYRAERDIRVITIYADGPQRVEVGGQPLLQVETFDAAWNGKYVLKTPVEVKRGSVISGRAWIETISSRE